MNCKPAGRELLAAHGVPAHLLSLKITITDANVLHISGHLHRNGLIFVLHIPQQHGVAHRQAVAMSEFLMDQHLAACFCGDRIALHHFKAAVGEIAVLLGVGVGRHPSGILIALRHLTTPSVLISRRFPSASK